MKRVLLLLIVALACQRALALKVTAVDFRSKVYDKSGKWPDMGTYINQNMAKAEEAIKAAKAGGTELIVFPEYGISNDDYIEIIRQFSWKTITHFWLTLFGNFKGIGYLSETSIPCDNSAEKCPTDTATVIPTTQMSLCYMSCLARRHGIAIMLNAMEAPKFNPRFYKGETQIRVFNTNFLFDNTGALVHKYRKMHPVLDEFWYCRAGDTVGTSGDLALFGNTKINSQVCLDLIYPDSGYNEAVNTVLFTTEWTSKQPLISILAQQGFSRATKTNLVAANMNKPWRGGGSVDNNGGDGKMDHMGSGIYKAGHALAHSFRPLQNPTNHIMPHYHLLTADIDPTTRPALPDAWTDNVDVRNRGGVPAITLVEAHKRRVASAYHFWKKADIGVDGTIAGDAEIPGPHGLKCSVTGKVVHGSVDDDDAFVLMALLGVKPASMLTLNIPIKGKVEFGKDDRYHVVCALFHTKQAYAANTKANRAQWDNFATSQTHTNWEKVKLTGNVWGNNVAVLPVIGTQETAGAKYYPKPLAHTTSSKWEIDGTDNTKMHLEADWGSGNEKRLLTIGLHGVVDEDGAVEAPVVVNQQELQQAAQEFNGGGASGGGGVKFRELNPYEKLLQRNRRGA